MLLSLTGASGAGKSTVLSLLSEVAWNEPVRCVEFDSVGVPADADTAWRHGAIEHWVQEALREQAAGCHLLLCGQVPWGELLAAPSAERVDGIAGCLLHCSPAVRRERLLARGEPAESIVHHVAFGEWFREHARSPTHQPEVIQVSSAVPMHWDRWAGWSSENPRWRVEIIDTDALTPTEVAQRAETWARAEIDRAGT